MADDVFDDNDRVVDDEADRNGKRHQGEVIERVAELIEHSERADQRERHSDRRNHGGPEIAQEDENDHYNERDREQ